jgi:hypothetical protein
MDMAAIGRQFGLDESQTRAALDALAPVVAAGVRRTAQSPEGLQDILSSVLTVGHGAASTRYDRPSTSTIFFHPRPMFPARFA